MTDLAWRWMWPGVDSKLLVSKSVADVLAHHRQQGTGVERGGQLFVNPDSPVGLVLSLATPPHSADRAGRSWLELDAERCRAEIESANKQGLRLVGYWHTHPQETPRISPTDVSVFSNFAELNMHELPRPMAIIVGTSKKPQGIKAWLFGVDGHVEATRID